MITTDAVTGFNCGRMIRKNTFSLEQPSIAAASSSAGGMEIMKFVYRKILVGSWKVTRIMIIPQ